MTRQDYILRKESFGGLIIDRRSGLLCFVNHSGYQIARLLLSYNNIGPEEVSVRLAQKYGAEAIPAILEDANKLDKILFTDGIQGTRAEENEALLSKVAGVPLTAPIDVFWEVTWRCNLKCIHCYNSSGSTITAELDRNDAIALVHEWSDIGVHKIVVGGGEPLVRSDLFDIIGYAMDLGMTVRLVSNGTLFSRERVAELLRSGLMEVSISIDGSTSEIHDSFRSTKGALKQVLAGCERLISNGVRLYVQTVVNKTNLSDIDRVIELCVHLGAASWEPKFLMPSGRAKSSDDIFLKTSDIARFAEVVKGLGETFGDKIRIETNVPLKHSIGRSFQEGKNADVPLGCGPGISTCGITPDGKLLTCSYIQDESWISKKIAHGEFSQVWRESRIFRPFRELRTSSLKECFKCELLRICNGGCRARAYLATGDFFAKDPYCGLYS